MKSYKPVVLVVMDGFGVSSEEKGNAVAMAKHPTLDMFDEQYPMTTLQASGVAVGLPWGEAGNSEVGHLTMGTGRVIYHHLPRIINAIQDGSFYTNEAFLKAAEHVKKNNSNFHILGLVSSGSVHSYVDHLYALMRFVEKTEIPRAFLHVITDGKDAPPKEGEKFLAQLEERMKKEFPHTEIASLIGRFYAMDRDEKWERVRKAYELLTDGAGSPFAGTISDYLRVSYEKGETDEFITPSFLPGADGKSKVTVKDGDALIIFNFREDSVREITHAFLDPVFDSFPRKRVNNLCLVTMTEYERDLPALAAFPPLAIMNPLARVLSDVGLRQLHIAETEKYAHVTYFFNGGREKPFPNEERILVPSVETAHVDETPEMKAPEIADKVVSDLARYDFVLCNFANTDMVGHSGNLEASVKAVEAVDRAVKEIFDAVVARGGVLLVTGDHGNVEAKRNTITGEKLTEHSLNPVPFYLAGSDFLLRVSRTSEQIRAEKRQVGGVLTDIAPTVLELFGVSRPQEMSGASLLQTLLAERD